MNTCRATMKATYSVTVAAEERDDLATMERFAIYVENQSIDEYPIEVTHKGSHVTLVFVKAKRGISTQRIAIQTARDLVKNFRKVDEIREKDEPSVEDTEPELLTACKRMLARLETETEWLVTADYPARFLVERHEHLMAYRDTIAEAKTVATVAPDLLDACKQIVPSYDLIKQNYPELVGLLSGMELARATIAKATRS